MTWCHKNNLSLNVSKPKEMIVDLRRRNRGHQHQHHQLLHIDGSALEKVGTIKFLGVHISEDLTWSYSTDQLIKKDQQQLYFLRKLRGPSSILPNFYRCTIESMHKQADSVV